MTDSTAYLTEEMRSHPDVYVVPIVVISEGKQYEDGVDLTSKQLYEIICNVKEVPKTSQPNVGKFYELYEKLKRDYDHAIAIHVSSKLSGTISSSIAGKDQAGFDVEVIDSHSLSFAITDLIAKGLKLRNEGKEVRFIAEELRLLAKNSMNLIVLGSLEQLYKGGRMSGTSFLLGNFLNIKPILSIDSNGELNLVERIRSEKKAITKIISLLQESCERNPVKRINIVHGNVREKAMSLKKRINKELPGIETVIGEISTSLAVHGGEGTIGVFWNIKE